MRIDFDNTSAFQVQNDENNNVSHPEKLGDIMNYGSNPFVIGSSKLKGRYTIMDKYDGFMGRKMSNATKDNYGYYMFPTPYPQITITATDGQNINGLRIMFDRTVGQYPTLLMIDGQLRKNASVEFQDSYMPDQPSHTIQFLAWSEPRANIRITSIIPTDETILSPIKIAKDRAGLNDPHSVFTKMFSSWKPKNTLVYAQTPSRSLAFEIENKNTDVAYIPRVDFDFAKFEPPDYAKFVQAVNCREFVIEYYDVEIMQRVIRKMYTTEYGANEFAMWNSIYRSAYQTKASFVSKYGYDAVDDNNNDIGYADLKNRSTTDTRF